MHRYNLRVDQLKEWNKKLVLGVKNHASGALGRPPLLDEIAFATIKSRLLAAEADHSRPCDKKDLCHIIREEKMNCAKRKLLSPESRVWVEDNEEEIGKQFVNVLPNVYF